MDPFLLRSVPSPPRRFPVANLGCEYFRRHLGNGLVLGRACPKFRDSRGFFLFLTSRMIVRETTTRDILVPHGVVPICRALRHPRLGRHLFLALTVHVVC